MKVGVEMLTGCTVSSTRIASLAYMTALERAPHDSVHSPTGEVTVWVTCWMACSFPFEVAAREIVWLVGVRCPVEVNISLRGT